MFATWLQEIYSIFVPKVKTKQMKRIFFVYPLAIATLFLIVLFAIPHHHHKEMMCTVMELCEQDDIYNDGIRIMRRSKMHIMKIPVYHKLVIFFLPALIKVICMMEA